MMCNRLTIEVTKSWQSSANCLFNSSKKLSCGEGGGGGGQIKTNIWPTKPFFQQRLVSFLKTKYILTLYNNPEIFLVPSNRVNCNTRIATPILAIQIVDLQTCAVVKQYDSWVV